jgi:hypothetical protein
MNILFLHYLLLYCYTYYIAIIRLKTINYLKNLLDET